MAEYVYECLVLHEPGKPLQLERRPMPTVPWKGALVEVHYSGLCHSDLALWEGSYSLGGGNRLSFADRPGYSYPLVPGHEVVGLVAAVGEGFTDDEPCPVAVGDRVAVYSFIGCGECPPCAAGMDNSCDRARQRGIGFQLAGGMATHVAVPDAKFLQKIPESVDLRTAAIASCSGLTALSAVHKSLTIARQAIAVYGQVRVLIIGAGGLGLWAIQLAKQQFGAEGKTRVVCADISEEKLSDARLSGADGTVLWTEPATGSTDENSGQPSAKRALSSDSLTHMLPGTSSAGDDKNSIVARTKEACGGCPDVIIDFVGLSKTSRTAWECLAQGGILVLIGLFGGSLDMPIPLVVLRCQNITGVHAGNAAELKKLIQLLEDGKVHSPPVEEFDWHNANVALQKMREGKIPGRAVLKVKN